MNYQETITESREHLLKLERATKDLKARDRVRFLRLLKTGKAATQKEAGALIGLQVRQSQRLWKQYRETGLRAMGRSNYTGGVAKLNKEQQARFVERLKQDDIWRLEQARVFLQQECGVSYTVGGVSVLCRRLKIKLTTGRPQNIKQKAAELEDFKKKNIRS
jgi:transposase